MKKIFNIIFWLLVVIYLVFAMGFIGEKRSNIICHTIQVRVLDSIKNGFVDDNDILSLLTEKGYDLAGKAIEDINADNIETFIREQPFIKNSQVYKTVEGKLVIDIIQRNPIARIINRSNDSYYIDEEGIIIPTSGKYTSFVLIINGYINSRYNINYDILSQDRTDNIIYDIFSIASFINNNKFWKGQIEQIYINREREFELIPRVGAHVILLGNSKNFEEKLMNLHALYLEGFKNKDWNNYKTINLKYANQIICTKR